MDYAYDRSRFLANPTERVAAQALAQSRKNPKSAVMSVALAPRPSSSGILSSGPASARSAGWRLCGALRAPQAERARRNEKSEVLHPDLGAVRVAVRARARGRHTCRYFDFEPGECDLRDRWRARLSAI